MPAKAADVQNCLIKTSSTSVALFINCFLSPKMWLHDKAGNSVAKNLGPIQREVIIFMHVASDETKASGRPSTS